jgi:hypothetical protein
MSNLWLCFVVPVSVPINAIPLWLRVQYYQVLVVYPLLFVDFDTNMYFNIITLN